MKPWIVMDIDDLSSVRYLSTEEHAIECLEAWIGEDVCHVDNLIIAKITHTVKQTFNNTIEEFEE